MDRKSTVAWPSLSKGAPPFHWEKGRQIWRVRLQRSTLATFLYIQGQTAREATKQILRMAATGLVRARPSPQLTPAVDVAALASNQLLADEALARQLHAADRRGSR